jgi:hypothetical protein
VEHYKFINYSCHSSGKNLLLYPLIERATKLTVVITK